MANKLIQARINKKEYEQLLEWKEAKEELQKDENIKYSISDLIRIGISTCYSLWVERKWLIWKREDKEEQLQIIKNHIYETTGTYPVEQEAIDFAVKATANGITAVKENVRQ